MRRGDLSLQWIQVTAAPTFDLKFVQTIDDGHRVRHLRAAVRGRKHQIGAFNTAEDGVRP